MEKHLGEVKAKTAAALRMVERNLSMKQLVEASQNVVLAATKCLKSEGKAVGSKEDTLEKIQCKIGLQKMEDSIRKLDEQPASTVKRSAVMRNSIRMTSSIKRVWLEMGKKAIKSLEKQIEKTKDVYKTLDIEAAAEKVKDLQNSSTQLLEVVRKNGLEASSHLDSKGAEDGLRHAKGKVSSCLDQMMTATLEGHTEAASLIAIQLVKNLKMFKTAAKDEAAALGNKSDQIKILESSLEVFKDAEHLLKSTQDFVINPESPVPISNINRIALTMTEHMNTTILLIPGDDLEKAKDMIKAIEKELNSYQHKYKTSKVTLLKTGQKRKDALLRLKDARMSVINALSKVKESASNCEKNALQDSSLDMAAKLDKYKNAVHGALSVSHQSIHASLLERAKDVMKQATTLVSDTKTTLNDSNKTKTDSHLNKTHAQIIEAMDLVEQSLKKGTDSEADAQKTRTFIARTTAAVEEKIQKKLQKKSSCIIKDGIQVEEQIDKIKGTIGKMNPNVTTKIQLSDLLSTTYDLVGPAESYIRQFKNVAATTKDPVERAEALREAAEIEALVNDINKRLRTHDITSSSSQLVSLWDDLVGVKSEIEEGKDVRISDKPKDLSMADYLQAGKRVQSTMNKMYTSASNASLNELSKESMKFSDNLCHFGETIKGIASSLEKQNDKLETLDNAIEVVEKSEKILNEAFNTIQNPSAVGSAIEFLASVHLASQALTSSMLSVPESAKETAPQLIGCMEQELEEFQLAMQSFDNKPAEFRTNASDVSKSLIKATERMAASAGLLVGHAQRGDESEATKATIQLVNNLSQYKETGKIAMLHTPEQKHQKQILVQLNGVLHKSSELVTCSHDLQANKNDTTVAKRARKTETELQDAMLGIIETFEISTSGCEMATKLMESSKDVNKKPSRSRNPKKWAPALSNVPEEDAHTRLLQSGADISSCVDNFAALAIEGNIEAVNLEAYPLAEKIIDFQSMAKELGGTLGVGDGQNRVVSHSNKVIQIAQDLMQEASKVGQNPAKKEIGKDLMKTAQVLNKAINATFFAFPGKEAEIAKEILSNLEYELGNFQLAMRAFNGITDKPKVSHATQMNVKECVTSIHNTVDIVANAAITGNNTEHDNATLQMVSELGHYKSTTQRVAAMIECIEDRGKLIGNAKEMIFQSKQFLSRSKKVLDNPNDANLIKSFIKSKENIKRTIKTIVPSMNNTNLKRNASIKLMKQASMELEKVEQSSIFIDVDMSEIKPMITKSSKEIVRLCHNWKSLDSQEKGVVASKIAEHYSEVAGNIKKVLQIDPEDENIKETTVAVQELGKKIMEMINSISSEEDQGRDSGESKAVTESCIGVINSMNSAAKKAKILEGVTKDLATLSADLETSIMFASAGLLTAEDHHGSFPGWVRLNSVYKKFNSDHREKLLAKAATLVENVKDIMASVSSTDDLIRAAKACLLTAQELSEEMKEGAASLGTDNQEAQVGQD